MKWPSWMPRVLFESALIVFSVLLALALDQWREDRSTEARAREAVAAITAEVQTNRKAAEVSRDFHTMVHANLTELASQKQLPSREVYEGGMFNPATLVQTAWTTARETGALDALPFDTVLKLSQVYERQARYVTLGSALVTDLYADVRRRDAEPVLRDGFAGFISITSDFMKREASLVRMYDDALATLASLPR